MPFSFRDVFKKDKVVKNRYIVITAPEISEYKEFFLITQDKEIREEFSFFKSFDLEDCKNHVEWWVNENRNKSSPNLIFFIRTTSEVAKIYDSQNSKLIGFVCLSKTGTGDFAVTGYHDLLNFGILKEHRNYGLMTIALKMTIVRFRELGYNLLPAFVKHNNLPSMKVLEKCGFTCIEESGTLLDLTGKLYIYRLK